MSLLANVPSCGTLGQLLLSEIGKWLLLRELVNLVTMGGQSVIVILQLELKGRDCWEGLVVSPLTS